MSDKLLQFPAVPEADRPRKLYYAGAQRNVLEALVASGWEPVDVRLMPNETDSERALCLKAWLEGVRLGSIEVDGKIAKYIELEAKIYGLLSGRQQEEKPRLNEADIDALLEIK